jgi:hypothetical protein
MKHRKSTDRARRFCPPLGDLGDRRPQRWRMINSVAKRLDVSWDDAEVAANEAAAKGWLMIEGRQSACLTDVPPERMWTLADDRQTVPLQVPPLRIAGMPEPLRIHLDFDAEIVDEIPQRLSVLRSQMLPAPK